MNRKIIYIQYTNPAGYPPLQHCSRILANAGWQVLFLGTGAFGADPLCFPYHEKIRVKKLPFCPAGWRQKLHYSWFALWAIFWVLYWRPLWVYASDPLSTPIALLLSLIPSMRFIYHEHDPPMNTKGNEQTVIMRFVLWFRRILSKKADYCIIPNQKRLQQFKSAMGDGTRALCVWNCPSKEEVSQPGHLNNGGVMWIIYHGTIVPPRLPSTVLRAMSILPEKVKLRIIGYETIGHIGYRRELRDIASKLGIIHRIEFFEPIPTRKELLNWCQKSNVGLALFPKSQEDLEHHAMIGASNKPFDYLACGLALLVSDLPDWRKLYVEPGYGLACDPDDAESIAKSLQWFLNNPEKMRKMGEKGRKRILEEWNYEKQFNTVLNSLNGTDR